jgi:hypothetical protein
MSTLMAPPAPRRRTLERTGMTPEQELELLIREQEVDDTFFVRKAAGEISLEGPAPGGLSGTVSDFLGIAYDFDNLDPDAQGEMVDFLPREEKSLFSVGVPHGTMSTYTHHKCRCVKCKASFATYRRQKRAEAKAAGTPEVQA